MAWPSAGPSRSYNLHQDLPPVPPGLPMKMPSPMHSPNPDQGWNTMNGNGHTQGYDAAEERGEGSKRNPLVDLMDSERTYVEQLALVIRVSFILDFEEGYTDEIASRGCLVKKGLSTSKTRWHVSLCRGGVSGKQGFWECGFIIELNADGR